MTALAQGSAGLALVMSFALLHTRQIVTAAVLLAVQSIAVASAALVLHRPLMAVPPVLLAGGFFLLRQRTPMLDAVTVPIGGVKLGIGLGAVLTVLCQSQGTVALPAAIVLLSILLAATRSHPLMQIIALVATQNGLGLTESIVAQPVFHSALPPLACLVLPLPLAAGLLTPALITAAGTCEKHPDEVSHSAKAWMAASHRVVTWYGWIDLALALAVFAATLIIPLDALGSIFGPLLALDGVLRSFTRRNRGALGLGGRCSGLSQTICIVVAACAPSLIIAWLAVLAAASLGLFPMLTRRWESAVLAFLAAGLALFGALLLPTASSALAYFSLFAGLAMIVAVVPDLAVVVVILILRLGNQTAWPAVVQVLGVSLALIALLGCVALLATSASPHRATLLRLAQSSIAALLVFLGQPESRFAALILLVLLILTSAAARRGSGPASTLALAGLGGIPPFGVFPGLVLVVLALSANAPWLLLPLGAAVTVTGAAAFPRRPLDVVPRLSIPSIAWLPLLLAVLVGYCAPERLVDWWRMLTAGHP